MTKRHYKSQSRWAAPAFIKKNLPAPLLKALYNLSDHQQNTVDRRSNYDLVVASYNIHKCVGTDKIFDPIRIVRVIAELQADIIALQEVDKRFGERIGLIDLQFLKTETGLTPVPLRTMTPNGHGWHGNALFLRQGRVHNISQITLPGVEPRGAIIIELETKVGLIRVITTHFGLLRHSRNKQAKMLLTLLQKRPFMPTVLIGDLNEWRMGKNSSLNHFSPYFDITLGTAPSFPSRFPLLALDRIFTFPPQLITKIESHYSPLARVASDHLPIKAYLNFAGITDHSLK
ncbi:endonuclease/exonuclease/phosphatase family protein [Bartonella australis AUST/NH1]|uniref:Endonuclease/exonuclease/phosphatase family protein n=1 Tax=Bartonella australis (strain Aust/NH1) TaxID=1094489 RepID=M1PB60_BARAA|nr:endonuclease/exonuclease/phosphatase family protein [Bartonella australis]AGF73901.1 endonuclease/exonuclease/phosphatase family protein [Bartonella australis AUST/NH1]